MRNHHRLAIALLLLGALASCGGNLGDLGPRVVVRPPILPPAATPQVGIVAMAAGDAVVRIDYVLPAAGFEAALFLAPTSPTVFQGPPVAEALTGTSMILTAATHPTLITNGTLLFAGFGIRAVSATDWTPIGSVIRCRPSSHLIYVDAAGPATGDGSTPANAFPQLDNALLVGSVFASIFGDINVWVLEGVYTTRAFDPVSQEGGAFTVGPNVHVYGGFRPGFDLAEREATVGAPDPDHPEVTLSHTGGRSILRGGPTVRIVDVISGGQVHILDGFTVDGRDTTTEGIDITESDCEVRSVAAVRCVDNGIRVKLLIDFTNRRNVWIVASDVSRNGNDGLGVAGVFNVVFDRSTFDANFGAGVDINDLLALQGSSAGVTAFGCRFFGNSLEGLGMDLNTVQTSDQEPGGRFFVTIDGCLFERNGTTGLDIDEDHDLFPAWHDTVRVRDCVARANRLDGIHIDADDQGDYVFDRIRCTANAKDGFLLTSEPDDPTTTADDQAPGHIPVTNSYFGGNLAAGLRASQGDKVLLVSHCVIAGNQGGGIVSELSFLGITNPRRISSVASSVFWHQPIPFTNTVNERCWLENVENPFAFAPESFGLATTHQDGALTLNEVTTITAGQFAVVGDDGVARAVSSAVGTSLIVSPPPTTFVAPDAVFGYPSAQITDDLRLLENAPAVGTALVAAGDLPRNPGPAGSIGGGEPGVFNPFGPRVLHLLQTEPPVATGVTPTTPIVLTFDLPLDVASITPERVRMTGATGIGLTVQDTRLVVNPPVGGWSGSDVLELNIGIAAIDGTPLGTALLLPVLIR